MSRIVPSMPCGDLPSLHSPQPVIPSSVSTLTNIHGRQPASTMNVSMLVIFMVSQSLQFAVWRACRVFVAGYPSGE